MSALPKATFRCMKHYGYIQTQNLALNLLQLYKLCSSQKLPLSCVNDILNQFA